MTKAWSPTALTFEQHQLSHVANFWKLGRKAEFHLKAGEGGLAELQLVFQLPSPCEPIPPPSYAPPSTPSSPPSAGNCGLKKANLSRVRRREKRAAERAAAENAAAASAVAAESAAAAAKEAETAAAVKGALETAAAEIAAPESAATEIAAECSQETIVDESGGLEGASTSKIPAPSLRSVEEELALPLCHYCCHKGSGMNPVHYESMCICDDKDCSCACYCTDAQREHRKLHFPGVWSDKYHKRRAVMLQDRPKAMKVAETRIVKWNGNRPCRQPSCLEEN